MERNNITFIDLFAGIGGFRLAFESLGCKCVFSSENDKYAKETYKVNFGEYPSGDITKIPSSEIPDYDILCAGFPCQPFSIAGKRKGFEDIRGTLFFEIYKILKDKRPEGFILENVRGLTFMPEFNCILELLAHNINGQGNLYPHEDCLNYNIFWKVLNTKDYGLPQNRQRVFMVGFKDNVNFEFPKPIPLELCLADLLEDEVDEKYFVKDKELKYISKRLNNKKSYATSLISHKSDKLVKGLLAQSYQKWRGNYVTDDKGDIAINPDIALKVMPNIPRWRGNYIDLNQIGYLKHNKRQDRIYSPEGCSPTIAGNAGGQGAKTGLIFVGGLKKNKKWIDNEKDLSRNFSQGERIYNSEGIAQSISSTQGGTGQKTGLYLVEHKKGNKYFPGNQIYDSKGCHSSINSKGEKDAVKIGNRIRRLTPRECARLQGFPDNFAFPVSDNQAYKQIGNAVSVPVVKAIANKMLETFKFKQEKIFDES